jgi:hypothetical protein
MILPLGHLHPAQCERCVPPVTASAVRGIQRSGFVGWPAELHCMQVAGGASEENCPGAPPGGVHDIGLFTKGGG